MRKALTVAGAVLFIGALAWLYHSTGRSAFLALAGATTGVLLRILWLEPRRARDVPADQPSPDKQGDPPGAP
ncbi:hypothetical protein ACFO1B_54260 [Dactylosporangium siamense]|uniref:Uncharacterized protein n=1 Tax=Dactylosporangium siamense TaxID=685454 RepID=A0A919PWA5_9ACTN|nr:hypothetical protein [Dactylosporangium siamense]GIG50852.1 hypothetical protein Dsi01nite_088930 [Dactylosporangium siamense]